MFRLFSILLFLTFVGCNTTDGTNNRLPLNKETENFQEQMPPSQVVENGLCMADTLSFLIGQPETALDAMRYPDNTRVLVHGQVVNPGVDPTRLNLVLGIDRRIKFVYCG